MKDQKEKTTETDTIEETTSESGISEKETDFLESAVKTVEDLKVLVSDKAIEIEELHNIASEQEKKFKGELAEATSKIDELQKALQDANEAKEEAIAELANLKEEALLQERLRALRDNSLLRTAQEAQIKQAEKISAMSEQEFASYFEDLLDIAGKDKAEKTSATEEENSKEDESVGVEVKKEEVAEGEVEDKIVETIEETTKAATDDEAQARIRRIIKSLTGDSQNSIQDVEDTEKAEDETEEGDGSPKSVKESESCKTKEVPSIDQMSACFAGILKLEQN